MKILVLSEVSPKRNGTLWSALGEGHQVDIRLYGELGLREALNRVAIPEYDKIVFASGVRRAGSQVLELSRLPEVFVYDLDLQQDYMKDSSYYGLFPAILRTLQSTRLIVTSLASQQHFSGHGFAASFLPKAYDHRLLWDQQRPRDIEFGFVGRTNHKIYRQRRALLSRLSEFFPIQMLRTEDASEGSDEYNALLNRIRFFISADAGFREFHIKNFEAMAAGCVLCALRTSQEEADILGFRDMENVVLYDSADELKAKMQGLRKDRERIAAIAEAGCELVRQRHSWVSRKDEMLNILQAGVAPSGRPNLRERMQLLGLKAYWGMRRQ